MDKSRETILILGARSGQRPAIHAAKSKGLRVIAADPDPHAEGLAIADAAVVCDLADHHRLLAVAKQHQVAGILTLAADYPIPTVARLCETLRLPGLTPEVAERSTNKNRMRRAFEAAGVPSPTSIPVQTESEAISAVKTLGDGVVIKPAMSHGGRGVTRVAAADTEDTIAAAFQRAVSFTRADKAIVEECVDGPEFSVEAATYRGSTTIVMVTDKLTTEAPFFVEVGHSQPSQHAQHIVDAVAATAVAAVAALGIDNSPSHSEVRWSSTGPVVMEVGARLGGGFITSHLVPLSCGVDMVTASIDLALGREPNCQHQHARGAAVRFLQPAPGRVVAVSGLKNARRVPGCRAAELEISVGDRVVPLRDATGRVGYVIADGADAIAAIAAAERAMAAIVIETRPEA